MSGQEIMPLTPQYFSNLIKLESDFANKTYTAETLDELVEYYSQAVEYYDSIKDHIASYFIYKIQDTLAQKKSFKLLRSESTKLATPKGNQTKITFEKGSAPNSAASTEGGSPSPNLRSTRVSFIGNIIAEQMNENSDQSDNEEDQNEDIDEDDELEMEDDDDEEEGLSLAELRMRARNRKKSARKSIATLKKKTQKLFILQMKLQDEKASAKQTLSAVMETFIANSTNNDGIVANNLAQQRRTYKKRLDERLALRSPIHDVHPAEIDFVDEGATGSTVFIDNGSNSPNLGVGLLHDSIDHGVNGSSY